MPPLNLIVEIANLRDQLATEPDGERQQSLAGRIMALEGQLPAAASAPPMDPTATQPLKRIRPHAAPPPPPPPPVRATRRSPHGSHHA